MSHIKLIEKTYDYLLRTVFGIVNPVKKQIIRTKCKVHMFINYQALAILKVDKFEKEFVFFREYIDDINKGAVWADQDFKSSNHFYNPYKRKGLYGRQNALELGLIYYNKALTLWKGNNRPASLFYLGAAMHIIQDMTIPQHANIRLLDSHRQYETYVKRSYQYIKEARIQNGEKGAYLLDSYENFIRFNARIALKLYKRYKVISNENRRFYFITKCALPLAKRTTAGAMVLFYRTINEENRWH